MSNIMMIVFTRSRLLAAILVVLRPFLSCKNSFYLRIDSLREKRCARVYGILRLPPGNRNGGPSTGTVNRRPKLTHRDGSRIPYVWRILESLAQEPTTRAKDRRSNGAPFRRTYTVPSRAVDGVMKAVPKMLVLSAALALWFTSKPVPPLSVFASPAKEKRQDGSAAIDAGRRAHEASDYAGAIQALLAAAANDPRNPEIDLLLAKSYYESQQPDAAITRAEKAVALNP